ncbi:MAG: hypothetical protein CM1200mP36_04060 [Gammaproteobacteria bacterium]|nr:MAG: hypothetical protein CM1200mP36_04060 [Gammaproteobacteria bacterium]
MRRSPRLATTSMRWQQRRVFEYLGVGLGTVALTAFIAKQTSRRFTATQFALLTSVTAVPRTFANATTGFIVEAIGYFNFFLLCVIVAIPGMLLPALGVAPWSENDPNPQPGQAPGTDSPPVPLNRCMIRGRVLFDHASL